MTKERLYLFDTTLRDGAQTTGVDFSLEDKRLIIRTLDELGLDYIEGGYPGANVTDTELFATEHTLKNATLTAFGMTKRAGRSVSNDPGFQAILQAKCGAICLVAKAWDYHVRVALGITNEENLQGVAQSVEAIVGQTVHRCARPKAEPVGKPKAEPARGNDRLRAFLRRLQGQPRLCAGGGDERLQVGRALGGAVRHQRRHAARTR